jgi:hypothetical protein
MRAVRVRDAVQRQHLHNCKLQYLYNNTAHESVKYFNRMVVMAPCRLPGQGVKRSKNGQERNLPPPRSLRQSVSTGRAKTLLTRHGARTSPSSR